MVSLPIAVYRWGWVLWALYFAVLEGLALADKQKYDTLSENIRWVRDQHPFAFIWIIGGTVTWLFVHFLYEDNT